MKAHRFTFVPERPATAAFILYAGNRGSYRPEAVNIETATNGWMGITGSLPAGQFVSTNPVGTLRFIELRATKSRGHRH